MFYIVLKYEDNKLLCSTLYSSWLIHTYMHIHSTDPVSASITSEYRTCQ